MKSLAAVAAAALIALPLAAVAQSSSTHNSAAKPAAKPASKPAPKQQAAKSGTQAKKPQVSRSAAKAVEEVTPIDADANVVLTEADLAVAQKVHTGRIQCELGADVTVTADEKKPGFFTVSTKGARYRMHPVESRTGAIRLEDGRAGAMWLQLGNKSMLMNQKQGVRMADECQAEAQVVFANEMKKNPPRSLLDDPTPSK
ncbi:hypothetical protein [Xenophilus sp. Marseille-Q4582]|uniref:hypothetical protein n=1 Tax=Xenophilus sp. Marseille-Q4582 TaxID=2866600 RepID=UPI001CE49ADA|nr:hypothetical protein [Xenophilus sp. Marseille-Q4582]